MLDPSSLRSVNLPTRASFARPGQEGWVARTGRARRRSRRRAADLELVRQLGERLYGKRPDVAHVDWTRDMVEDRVAEAADVLRHLPPVRLSGRRTGGTTTRSASSPGGSMAGRSTTGEGGGSWSRRPGEEHRREGQANELVDLRPDPPVGRGSWCEAVTPSLQVPRGRGLRRQGSSAGAGRPPARSRPRRGSRRPSRCSCRSRRRRDRGRRRPWLGAAR